MKKTDEQLLKERRPAVSLYILELTSVELTLVVFGSISEHCNFCSFSLVSKIRWKLQPCGICVAAVLTDACSWSTVTAVLATQWAWHYLLTFQKRTLDSFPPFAALKAKKLIKSCQWNSQKNVNTNELNLVFSLL